jgi:hypothetical protein
VCDRIVAGIAGSNPFRGMDVCLLCLYVVLSCVGRGLRDGLITRPEESYRVSVCVIKKPLKGSYVPVGNERKMNEWVTKVIVSDFNEGFAQEILPLTQEEPCNTIHLDLFILQNY